MEQTFFEGSEPGGETKMGHENKALALAERTAPSACPDRSRFSQ
jgi:hypothetical protein